jgi:MoaA/NifB/PqqE/SkfB family radical SAM enzyme
MTEKLLNAGISDFLISIHGLEKVHEFVTQNPGGREKQERFIKQIHGRVNYRFNCVITKWNQDELYKIAKWMIQYKPSIINFINFNPHTKWQIDPLTKEIIANLGIIQMQLNSAIKLLQGYKIGVNLRYYPMCCVNSEYWPCVCNDYHVVWDQFEWDYDMVKTTERFMKWTNAVSNSTEEKGAPCNTCDLHNACGGANKYFHAASNEIYGEVLKPVKLNQKPHFYEYRQHAKTLEVNY